MSQGFLIYKHESLQVFLKAKSKYSIFNIKSQMQKYQIAILLDTQWFMWIYECEVSRTSEKAEQIKNLLVTTKYNDPNALNTIQHHYQKFYKNRGSKFVFILSGCSTVRLTFTIVKISYILLWQDNQISIIIVVLII